MDYSILKDDAPENTILRIKNILKRLDIEIQETIHYNTWYQGNKEITPIVIVRIESIKPKIGGTNGKGTSVENAKASAYAEFMERLQNFILFGVNWLNSMSNDRKIVSNYKQLEIDEYFKYIIKSNIMHKFNSINNYTFLPFYNIKKKTECNLPYDIISFLQGSNGMSAGNTMEEALVQGLSEICERYSLKEIYRNKIALDSIPPPPVYKL